MREFLRHMMAAAGVIADVHPSDKPAGRVGLWWPRWCDTHLRSPWVLTVWPRGRL
jgi:hypothetical protein